MRVDMDANDRQLQAVYNDFASFFLISSGRNTIAALS